jgi:hypothetical protein
MSDIFISYAREDKERAAVLAKALESNGWSVWWDRKIPPGKTFATVIEEAIDTAKCVIVLWSEHSTDSDWVQNEASEGARKKILVPALIDDVKIPFEFRRIQAADLTDWKAQPNHPGFANLINAVSQFTGPPAPVDKTEKPAQKATSLTTTDIHPEEKETEKPKGTSIRSKRSKKKFIIVSSLLVCFIAIASVWYYSIYAENKKRIRISGQLTKIIGKLEYTIENGKNTKSLEEINKINDSINKVYNNSLKKLSIEAKELNMNVGDSMEKLTELEKRWQIVYQKQKRELTRRTLRPPTGLTQ